jgi:hypothetical protein
MSFNAGQEMALIGIRLLDDAQMAWVAAELEAEHALCAWSQGVGKQYGTAYDAYRAAVDREEAAARELERLHELVCDCLERDGVPG